MNWIDVEIQGRKIRVAIVRAGGGAWVSWPGQSRFLGPERTNASGPAVVEREIRAPMTGRVLQLAATPGSKVRAHDVLAILEAMKMEYRLVAPRDGVVESVGCKEGDLVDLGRVIVVLEP